MARLVSRPWFWLTALLLAAAAGWLAWHAAPSTFFPGRPHFDFARALDAYQGNPVGPNDPRSLLLEMTAWTGAAVGFSRGSVMAVQLVVFLGFLGALFLAGRALGGPWVGILAAAIGTVTPAVVGLSRDFNDHLFNLLQLTLAAWLIASSDRLRDWRRLAAAGALIGAALAQAFVLSNGMLVVLAALGLLAGEALEAFLTPKPDRPSATRLGLGLAVFGAALAGALWLSGYDPGVDYLRAEASGDYHTGPWWQAALAFPAALAQLHLEPLLFAFWLAALVVVARRRPRHALGLLGFTFAPLLVLAPIAKKNEWYVLPLLPAVALVAALAARPLLARPRGRIAVGAAWVLLATVIVVESILPRPQPDTTLFREIWPAVFQREQQKYVYPAGPYFSPAYEAARKAAELAPEGRVVLYGGDPHGALRFHLVTLAPKVAFRTVSYPPGGGLAVDAEVAIVVRPGDFFGPDRQLATRPLNLGEKLKNYRQVGRFGFFAVFEQVDNPARGLNRP
jgi:hypothetical protein